jgi:alpha-glucosidase
LDCLFFFCSLRPEAIRAFYGADDELHLPFNFGLFNLPWQAESLRAFVDDYDPSVPDFAWPVYVLSNHDRSRVASRVGPAQARCAAMLLMTLRGSAFVYYGEELGMEDVPIPAARVQDPWEINMPGFGRDPVRTPMCWDSSANSGFSTRTPWLPQAADFATQHVEAQQADPGSMLNLYRALIQLRKDSPALHSGSYCADDLSTDSVFVYLRQHKAQRVLVALNFSDQPQSIALPQGGTLRLSTFLDRSESVAGMLRLRPHEGCLIELA